MPTTTDAVVEVDVDLVGLNGNHAGMSQHDELVTTAIAARIAGRTTRTIRRWHAAGILPSHSTNRYGHPLFAIPDIAHAATRHITDDTPATSEQDA